MPPISGILKQGKSERTLLETPIANVIPEVPKRPSSKENKKPEVEKKKTYGEIKRKQMGKKQESKGVERVEVADPDLEGGKIHIHNVNLLVDISQPVLSPTSQ